MFKRLVSSAVLFFALLCAAPAVHAQKYSFSFVPGGYVTGTSYSANDVILSGTTFYVSQQSANQGNALTNTAYWLPLGGGGGTSITLKTNGTANTVQTILNIAVGTGITATADSSGNVTLVATEPAAATEATTRAAAISALTTQLGNNALSGVRKANTTSPDTVAAASDVDSSLGYVPAAGAQHVAGGITAFYDYLPSHIVSGTVQDQSGSGNNATEAVASGSTAPTSVPTGLQFAAGTASLSLPSALNSTRTFEFGFALPSVTSTSSYPVLFGSSVSSGLTAIMAFGASSSTFVPQSVSITLYNDTAGTHLTSTPILLSTGPHTLIITLGSNSGDLTHIVFDGSEVPYTTQTYTEGGLQASGNFIIGNPGISPFAGMSQLMTMYETILRSTELASTSYTAESNAIFADMQQRGVQIATNVPFNILNPYIVAVGDSLTFGTNSGTGGYPTKLSLLSTTPTFQTITNLGQPGFTAATMANEDVSRIAKYCQSQYGPSTILLQEATNDFLLYPSSTAWSVWGSIVNHVAILHKAGCQNVFVGTMIARGNGGTTPIGSPSNGLSWAVNKDALNQIMLSSWKLAGIAGLTDTEEDPNLGADTADTNTTYYSTIDQTHLYDAGYQLMANAWSNTINYFYGYNESMPHIVTASTYQMLANDGYVDLQPTAATTVTLPSCIGPAGVSYRINNPQSTYAITLKTGSSAQPLNGTDYSSTGLTLPSNATITLRDVPNALSSGGCHWEM